jgi:predicted CoA-substrate-specific enzyme activase
MGIDLGSTSTEVVVLDENSQIAVQEVIDTEPHHKTCIDKVLALVYQELSRIYRAPITKEDIQFCVGTGYGRENIYCADKTVSEISCFAKGAHYYFHSARTIIDMGGQDSKVIGVDENGEVKDFVMNEKCAAGTGRFLEAISEVCEISLDDLGAISLEAEYETTISSMCTVFAESEVISKLAEGVDKESIIKGLHSAIAFRVLSMGKRIGIKAPLVFSGGVARNIGMVQMLKEKTGFAPHHLLVPPNPQIIGALGAAFFAAGEGKKQYQPHQSPTAAGYVTGNGSPPPLAHENPVQTIRELEKEIPIKHSSTSTHFPPVVGWTDLAVPVELLSAANINHIRITGDMHKGASSDRYIRTYSCAYIKNAISALFEESEKYNFLDGVITTNCCSATEKMADVLKCQHNGEKEKNKQFFVYSLTIPRKFSDEAIDYMKKHILALKDFIENAYKTSISQDRLKAVCEQYNRARMLMREYTALLAENNFPNSARFIGWQMEQLWRQRDVTDDFLADIRRKIDLLKGMSPLEKQGPRILLAGSIIPDMHFYDMFDNIKCHVVYNHTSSGNKFSEALVDLEDPDIYRALARRCLSAYTPRTMDSGLRMAKIKGLVDRCNARGIIFNLTKFCVYYTFEAVLLKEYCEQWHLPLLVIETDFTSKSLGQLKTRIEAFIETFEKNRGV